MAADGKVVYEVDYDTKKADESLTGFSKKLNTVGQKAGAIGDTLSKNVTAPLVGLTGTALAGFFKVSTELDAIGKTAAGINASAEGLQALQFAGRKAGIESDKMADVLKKVQELTTNNAEAFQEAGIEITGMNDEMLESDKIFNNIIDALSGVSVEQRNATLLALGFTEELVSINKAMEDTAGFASNVEKGLQNAVSDETIKDFEEFNDKVEDLKQQFGLVAVDIATELLPHLEQFADWLTDGGAEAIGNFITKIADFMIANKEMIAGIAIAGPAIQTFAGIVNAALAAQKLLTASAGGAAAAGGATAAGGTVAAGGAATGGLAIGGAAAAGIGAAGVASLIPAGVMISQGKFFESVGDFANTAKEIGSLLKPSSIFMSPEERRSIFTGAFNRTSESVGVMNSGSVNIAKVEVNTTTELSPENQGRMVDDIMTSVSNELTMRAVFGK